jgi:uncharacterized membrane protein
MVLRHECESYYLLSTATYKKSMSLSFLSSPTVVYIELSLTYVSDHPYVINPFGRGIGCVW